jgi:hypothetical protein
MEQLARRVLLHQMRIVFLDADIVPAVDEHHAPA